MNEPHKPGQDLEPHARILQESQSNPTLLANNLHSYVTLRLLEMDLFLAYREGTNPPPVYMFKGEPPASTGF